MDQPPVGRSIPQDPLEYQGALTPFLGIPRSWGKWFPVVCWREGLVPTQGDKALNRMVARIRDHYEIY